MGRRKLGVEILDKLEDLEQIPAHSVDGFFASHVLEHLLSLKEIFEFFARVLKPGGVVFIMVPNSGRQKARDMGIRWQAMINEKHTLALEGKFFEKNMAPFGFDVWAFSDTENQATLRNRIDQKSALIHGRRGTPDHRPSRRAIVASGRALRAASANIAAPRNLLKFAVM